jgi:AcrR family transcriptional regulator
MATASVSTQPKKKDGTDMRARIMDAAFSAFVRNGYAATSTLAIASGARVSKRELYALVGNKQDLLIACISTRAMRLKLPVDMPVPRDRETLAQVLASFATQLLREVSDPAVVAMFRLAIAEADRTPEIARTLDSLGRESSRAALKQIMVQAQTAGLIDGRPADLAEQFSGLLWGNLMVSLLLGVVARPSSRDIAGRARGATAMFLRLHPCPRAKRAASTILRKARAAKGPRLV